MSFLCVQGRKVPASIASKSREELEVLAVNLLKTLKQRDKKIAGERCSCRCCMHFNNESLFP
jgi:hypothetical protein